MPGLPLPSRWWQTAACLPLHTVLPVAITSTLMTGILGYTITPQL